MPDMLLEQIRLCTTLPTLPAATAAVLRATADPDADPIAVARLVAKDAGLAVKVLKSINSSYYGLRIKMTSVERAVPLIGLRNLKFLIRGLCLYPALRSSRAHGFDHAAFWRRNLYASAAASVLAGRALDEGSEDTGLVVLLMDVGMLVLAEVLGSKYGALVATAHRHADLPTIEEGSLGLDHAKAGAFLAAHWKLQESIASSIRCHHDPLAAAEGPTRLTAQLAMLAGACADVFIEPDPLWDIAEVHRLAADLTGMLKPEANAVLVEVDTEARRLSVLYGIALPNPVDFVAVQRRVAVDFAGDLGAKVDPSGPSLARDAIEKGRRAERVLVQGVITVFPCHGASLGRSLVAGFVDVSVSGIGLRAACRLEPGSEFVLGLRRAGGKVCVIMYLVRNCIESPSGFKVGAQVVRILRDTDLKTQVTEDSPLHRLGRVLLSSSETPPSKIAA